MKIKWGETYESLAKNITPYLNKLPRYTTISPSIYPGWWDKTITIFNRNEDVETGLVTWYRNVLDNCFWKSVEKQQNSNNTVANVNSIIVRIPQNTNFKTFNEWNNIQDKEFYFTLKQGDIIVLGDIEEDIDEYSAGLSSGDFLTKYQGMCLEIGIFNINVHRGVGLPHYYATGN